MKWHRRADTWLRTHPGRVDATLAALAFLLLGPAYILATGTNGSAPRFWGFLVASAGLGLALAWRRVRPRRALWVAVVACLLQLLAAGEPMPLDAAVPVIVYSVTAYGRRVDGRWALVAAGVGSVLATIAFTNTTFGIAGGTSTLVNLRINAVDYAAVFVFHVLLCGATWLAGDLTRNRRLAHEAIADRARRLEQEQEQERALAAADERRRIAREMHDVVAHSLSVIIAQADGGRYAAQADPEVAARTLGTIAKTGRSALQEMRSLLGVLRASDDEAAPTAPAPDLRAIPELVRNTRAAGLGLEFEERGTPLRALPPGAELAAYRAAQESVTNVLKHAGPGATASLVLTWTARGLGLSVTDSGRGAAPGDGRGRGQDGMRERAALYGGTATFGPRAGGGYAVNVFLPYQEI